MAISPGGVPVVTGANLAGVANYHWDTNSLDWVKSTGSATAPSVSVSNFPASQAVTGTFWQATQPVSGTFWQATQPVSGTVAATQSGTWTVQPGNTPNTTPWRTSDTVDGAGVQGALTVGNSAVAVKVGGSAHANRKLVTLYNNSAVVLYWGWTNAVTTSTGTPIQAAQFASWNAGPNATIYVIAASGSNDTRVTEVAL